MESCIDPRRTASIRMADAVVGATATMSRPLNGWIATLGSVERCSITTFALSELAAPSQRGSLIGQTNLRATAAPTYQYVCSERITFFSV